MKEMKQRRKKERTWAEAARLVLENYSDAPMTPKQILQVIEAEGLKEMSGTSPLACLNAMLHSNSRGGDGLFYKLPGRISLFTLKKDALQWSRNLSVPEGEELEDTADAESCESNEASTVSGDNDVSLDETSSNASCSTESQSKGPAATRESYRAASQTTKQKKKTGVMLPRVVLTPLKVNGAHMESASGFTGRHADGESSSTSSSSSSSLALCKATLRSRTEINRDPPQLLRGIRKPTAGQMKRNRGEDIDFETPGSILVNTNLRALINSRTFNALPSHFQQQLLYLLPEVDRQVGADGLMRLSGSALNNEFFTHAAQSWRERLADGEFTHEMQVRIRQEMEKEKRVEQWKEKFFEDYYGQKLGLTQEESQEQSLVQEDAENRTGLSVKAEARLPRGPATRQRDGHLKKRSRADLRCRARRSLYKLREPEQTEPSKEAASAGPDPSLHKETKPETDVEKDDPTSPSAAVLQPESSESHLSPETSKLHGKSEDPAAAAAANRIPSFPQENSAREAKDQKRKCFEEAASASFPEKKPRLEDRQSFRNTIESVHPEKPQPTKEEPKVPPIRIQLSRIKPPWVVKGQPAYQICPRIIPNTEPSGRGRAGARTLADIKARALQARAQREAAAAAIGGGGGPGGGRSTGEGGGGGESRSRGEHRRSKRAHGKRSADLQRAQLLSSLRLNAEKADSEAAAQEARANSFPSSRRGPRSSENEGRGDLERAASTGSGDAAPGDGSPRRQLRDALTGSSLDSATRERQEESPEQLPCDPRTETPSCVASQERQSTKVKRAVPPVNGLSCSQVLGAAVGPAGDAVVSERGDACAPTGQPGRRSNVKDDASGCPALLPELSPAGKECHKPGMVSRFRFSGSEIFVGKRRADSDNSSRATAGAEKAAPAPCDCAHLQAEKETDGKVSHEEQNADSLVKPALRDEFIPQNRIDTSDKLQLRERCPRTEPENVHQLLRETREFKTNGDDEIQSTHSETTDTASDFEADLADDNVEMDPCFKSVGCDEAAGKDSSNRGSMERRDRIPSNSSVEGACPACVGDLPAPASTAPPAQRWAPRTPLPQKGERPPGPARLVASLEANNPLVMRLLKGNLSLEEVLPVSHTNVEVEMAQPPLDKQSGGLSLQVERGRGCYFDKESSQGKGTKMSVRSRSDGFHSMRFSVDPQEKCGAGAALPRAEDGEDQSVPEKHSKVGSALKCREQLANVASASQKPEDRGPRERTFSSCSFEEQKELPKGHRVPQHNPLTSVITSESPEKSDASTEPRFLSPTSLGPNQTGAASAGKNYVGVQGKKLFGSAFPCNPSVRLHHSRALDQVSAVGTSSPGKPIPLDKSCVPGEGAPAARDGWASKQHPGTPAGIENENVSACGSPGKSDAENRQDAAQNPAELAEQSVPLGVDWPFFKLSREPGKGHNHPLEPSSIPSQLNIKQAFYGKLSKLQLNSTGFNYSSNTPAFPRSFAGSVMQLAHKANFAANRNAALSVQMFADGGGVDEISFKCSCSLKAMIMCKGCGAFCHDDCIGPSKLCVLCLVVR